jgi:hypothetical protein
VRMMGAQNRHRHCRTPPLPHVASGSTIYSSVEIATGLVALRDAISRHSRLRFSVAAIKKGLAIESEPRIAGTVCPPARYPGP